MSIANSVYHIKRRVDAYLWDDGSSTVAALRDVLIKQFFPVGKIIIVGGLIRDLARAGVSGFKSDIDLIIDAPNEAVDRLAVLLDGKRNTFGGFACYHKNWKIDFWAFDNTWAHKAGYVKAFGCKDLLNATFFDIDAVLYDLNEREVHTIPGYVELLYSKTLDINLLPNPSVKGNALRAVRRLLAWGLRPKTKLSRFLEDTLNDEIMSYIIENEYRLYQSSYADSYRSPEELLEALRNPRQRKIRFSGQSTQYYLPL